MSDKDDVYINRNALHNFDWLTNSRFISIVILQHFTSCSKFDQFGESILELDGTGFPAALSADLLDVIAEILSIARTEASDRQDEEFGDDAQVLGMRAYKHAVKLFLELSIEDIEVRDPHGRCTLVVAGVPLRFWKSNNPDDPTEEKRLVYSSSVEPQLALFEDDSEGLLVDRWAIVYQTDFAGLFLTASLQGYNSATNQVIKSRPIKLTGTSVNIIYGVDPTPAKAVQLSDPSNLFSMKGDNSDEETSHSE